MTEQFFERPILNSPYEYPAQHWELDDEGQPTTHILNRRRSCDFITPVPKPKKRRKRKDQAEMVLDTGDDLSSANQAYTKTIINEIRSYVEAWRSLPNPDQRQVAPKTARLLQHWRHHRFQSIHPLFCQVELVKTAIWLTKVNPKMGNSGTNLIG